MDEALRRQGLDEPKMAEILGGVVERIEGKPQSQHGDDKLLMDVVKECNRHFESPPPARGNVAANDAPVIINLIHNVRRPFRPPAAAGASQINSPVETNGAAPIDAGIG